MLIKFVSRIAAVSGRAIKRTARSCAVSPNTQNLQQFGQARCFSALSAKTPFSQFPPISNPILLETNSICSSGIRSLQTKGDQDLVEFLEKEISAEKKSRKKLPDLSPFEASFQDAEVTLTRKTNTEIITVKFNINNSLDEDEEEDANTTTGNEEEQQMNSRPNFSVEIERDGKILSLDCSFCKETYDQQQQQEQEAYDDVFIINEMSVYEGDFTENTYSTSGDILDGSLYDLLITMMDERGINNEFVEKISEFSTAYEHERYVNLLENLKKFFK